LSPTNFFRRLQRPLVDVFKEFDRKFSEIILRLRIKNFPTCFDFKSND